MKIAYHKKFIKHFKKRIITYPAIDRRYKERLKTFLADSSHTLLADHPLHGNMEGYRSFSVSGDIRVIYRVTEDTLLFYDIGTHNQVYS